MKRGMKAVIYWCMETRDWPDDWRNFIDRAEGEPCKWLGSSAQCKACKGERAFAVTVGTISRRKANKLKKGTE